MVVRNLQLPQKDPGPTCFLEPVACEKLELPCVGKKVQAVRCCWHP
jgi:hypothetical protein